MEPLLKPPSKQAEKNIKNGQLKVDLRQPFPNSKYANTLNVYLWSKII